MRTLMSLAVIAVLFRLSMAANYTVGGPNGSWDTSTDLKSWAASQNFLVGDYLIFQYAPIHSVFEVSQADYDSCQTSNPIQGHNGGSTIITLSTSGSRYFICGTSGHCSQGMKVEIDILSTPTPPPSSPVNTPPPNSPAIIPPVSTPPSPLTSAPSPSLPIEITPTIYPPSPPKAPLGNPESPTVSPSPDVSLRSPSPSSANEDSIRTTLTLSISLVMLVKIFAL